MAYTSKIAWETLRVLNAASLAGAYVALGGPLLNPSYKLKMVNNSTSLVTVSINGTTDIDVCPPGTFWLYDEDVGTGAHEAMPKNTQIFVNGAAGTGNIYLVTQFIVQN